jgi:hypothetical protein
MNVVFGERYLNNPDGYKIKGGYSESIETNESNHINHTNVIKGGSISNDERIKRHKIKQLDAIASTQIADMFGLSGAEFIFKLYSIYKTIKFIFSIIYYILVSIVLIGIIKLIRDSIQAGLDGSHTLLSGVRDLLQTINDYNININIPDIPKIDIPGFQIPGLDTPDIHIPGIPGIPGTPGIPEIKTPGFCVDVPFFGRRCTPEFTTPAVPGIPGIPGLPDLNVDIPDIPSLNVNIPSIPSMKMPDINFRLLGGIFDGPIRDIDNAIQAVPRDAIKVMIGAVKDMVRNTPEFIFYLIKTFKPK